MNATKEAFKNNQERAIFTCSTIIPRWFRDWHSKAPCRSYLHWFQAKTEKTQERQARLGVIPQGWKGPESKDLTGTWPNCITEMFDVVVIDEAHTLKGQKLWVHGHVLQTSSTGHHLATDTPPWEYFCLWAQSLHLSSTESSHGRRNQPLDYVGSYPTFPHSKLTSLWTAMRKVFKEKGKADLSSIYIQSHPVTKRYCKIINLLLLFLLGPKFISRFLHPSKKENRQKSQGKTNSRIHCVGNQQTMVGGTRRANGSYWWAPFQGPIVNENVNAGQVCTK